MHPTDFKGIAHCDCGAAEKADGRCFAADLCMCGSRTIEFTSLCVLDAMLSFRSSAYEAIGCQLATLCVCVCLFVRVACVRFEVLMSHPMTQAVSPGEGSRGSIAYIAL